MSKDDTQRNDSDASVLEGSIPLADSPPVLGGKKIEAVNDVVHADLAQAMAVSEDSAPEKMELAERTT